jgi:PAS domain S-box-containing protein
MNNPVNQVDLQHSLLGCSTATPDQPYCALVESLHGIIWQAEGETLRFTFVNRAAEQVLGYPIDQWLTQPDFWSEHLHPDDRDRAIRSRKQAVQTQQNDEMEYRMVAADGSVVWLRDTVTVIAQSHQPLLQGIMFDRTAAHADCSTSFCSELYQQVQQLNATLEQQVQERTAQLQQARSFDALLKRITDKVRDSLDEGQILQTVVQELCLGLSCLSCDTAVYDFEQGTSTICYEYTTTLTHTQGTTYRFADYPHMYEQLHCNQWLQCSDCHSVRGWVTILACAIVDDQGIIGDVWLTRPPGTVFSNREVQLVQQVATQCAIALRQARLYQAAQTQVRELEKLNQLKDDFLSTVSHELRTPVSNMRMAIQMLMLSLKDGAIVTAKIDRYLQILSSQCEREIQLINDLLDCQRLESEAAPLRPTQAIDLPDWLPPRLIPLQERARSRQQSFQLVLTPALPTIQTDSSELERILVELLNNACKYTPPRHHIQLDVYADAKMLWLQVSNTGVEIPAHELPRIFEKFYRVSSHDPWRQSGTGLGLALVQKLTQRLGGTIQANSGAGKTCFTLALPIDRTQTATADSPQAVEDS